MKKALLTGTLLFILAPAVLANSVPACPQTNLQDLINLSGGCMVGSMLLTNFSYSSTAVGNVTDPPPSMIGVTFNSNFGVTFSGTWAVASGQSFGTDSLAFTISWAMQALNGTSFSGAGASTVGGGTGDPLFFGGLIASYSSGVTVLLADPGDTIDAVQGPPLTISGAAINVTIRDNYILTSVSGSNRVLTPEPTTLMLVASGALGLLVRRRMIGS